MLFSSVTTQKEVEAKVIPATYELGLIAHSVIIKPNMPTTDEEILQVKKYEQVQVKVSKGQISKVKKGKIQVAVAVAKKVIIPKAGWGGECVAWAKKVTGVFGTWGSGGRKLSLNSTGQIGDVVIFNSIHVAVVTARVDQNLTITESNYDWHGHIRTRKLKATDKSIRGFHKF